MRPSQMQFVPPTHPALREIAKPVPMPVTKELRDTIEAMYQLMFGNRGAGLAAPQVGLSLRIFVIRFYSRQNLRVFINPVITKAYGHPFTEEEGCLSLPGVKIRVARPPYISITATNLFGRTFTASASDQIARVIQHEMDHLDGVLITDKPAKEFTK